MLFRSLSVSLVLVVCLAVSAHAQSARTIGAIVGVLTNREETVAIDIDVVVAAPVVADKLSLTIPVSDKTGSFALRFSPDRCGQLPAPGDRIRVVGSTSLRNGIAYVQSQVSITARGPSRPVPTPVKIDQLKSGVFDWQFTRIEGIVCDVLPSDTNPNWVFLVLRANNDTLTVTMPLNEAALDDFNAFLRASVSIEGFSCPRDGSVRLYQGRIFQAAGISAVRMNARPVQDPFSSVEVKSLRFQHPFDIALCGFACARGFVIARWGSHDALVKTADNDIIHLVCNSPPPKRGSFVEAAGFPHSDLFHITLGHALWRDAEPIPVETASTNAISPSELQVRFKNRVAALANLHGKTIRFTGRLRSLPNPASNKTMLLVEVENDVIPVEISNVPHVTAGLQPGSLVEITATCVLNTDHWSPSVSVPQIHGFTAVLNDEQGLKVLVRPPWWTVGRILLALGIVFLALIAVVIYGQIARARAVVKTEERTRLAVELHDTLSQSLTGVSLELEAARNARGDANAVMTAHLETAARVLTSCRQELKNCLWDLRNKALEADDLNAAIRMTLRPLIDDECVSVRFNLPRRRISDSGTHTLLRIIRELVINALRHGRATGIRIAGCIDGKRILCSVADNGSGFDPATAPGVLQGHFGLQGLRERVAERHGSFTIASSPGKGTRARISLPDTI